jgi:ubiquinone/menaquinone biosynthesis C-methylase UbiE
MTHENEYHNNMITLLQLVWGEGYLAPGGPGNVAKMLQGIVKPGDRILDIGCGIGGPALEMARTFGARVVGIDLEQPLVERATRAAEQLGLSDRCSFRQVEVGPLIFDDGEFDIVVSAGALTQTSDKAAVFEECFRVLQPGGHISLYDWTKSEADISDDMRYWFKMEGLTYSLETLDAYAGHLASAGFVEIKIEDASHWYRQQVNREYQLMKGELYPRMLELLGRESADHFVENWRAMTVVCNSGEMRQGYCRARRPQ